MSAYSQLEQHFGHLGRLSAASAILQWDTGTVMPKGGAGARSQQLAALRKTIHSLETDPKLAEWVQAAAEEDLDPWQRANLKEIERAIKHAQALPASLVEAMTHASTECEMTWREARPANDFATLQPKLERMLELSREKAQAKADALGVSPYDALLDEYEPGGSAERIDKLFAELASFLPELTERILERQAAREPAIPLPGPFEIGKQRELGETVMRALGFDFDHGRLDISVHPFCGGVPDDVRITTRYTESNFIDSLMGIIHETGHAMYERGLPPKWRYQPVGHARGMSMHESQSLLMEMQASRSREFLQWVAPVAQGIFGGTGDAWSATNLYRHYTHVERGLIRVEADEVTYPAHVILRYELERAMISGDLSIADLPGAWRERMKSMVGITPDTDKDGCMQDIHWMDGAFGYFPTYTMGALTAAQLFQSATKAVPDIRPAIARGEFLPLLGWLRENVHGLGSSLDTDEILTKATGQPLSVAPFRAHLEARYLSD